LNNAKRKAAKIGLDVRRKAKAATHPSVKRAVGYMRVSTTKQAAPEGNEAHADPKLQTKVLDAFFKKSECRGIEYENVYSKLGIPSSAKRYKKYIYDIGSGTGNERPGFRRLISFLESGQLDCIVVPFVDRLARNEIGAQELVMALTHASAIVIEVGHDPNYPTIYDFDPSSPAIYQTNVIQFNIAMTGASIFAVERSSSSRKSAQNAIESNIFHTGGKAKFGYEWVYDGKASAKSKFRPGKFEIVPKEAAIIREIYSLYAWGLSGKPTIKRMGGTWFGLGITSIANRLSDEFHKPIRKDFVQRVLHDRAYDKGEYVFRKTEEVWHNHVIRSYAEQLKYDMRRSYTEAEKRFIIKAIDERNHTNFSEGLDQVFKDAYPIIVKDVDTANAVRKRIKDAETGSVSPRRNISINEKGEPVSEPGWLSGLLYCPYCGHPYFRAHRPDGPKGNGFYVTGATQAGEVCRNQTNVSYSIDDAVFRIVAEIVFGDNAYKTAFSRFLESIGETERKRRLENDDRVKAIASLDEEISDMAPILKSDDDYLKSARALGDSRSIKVLETKKSRHLAKLDKLQKRRSVLMEQPETGENTTELSEIINEMRPLYGTALEAGKDDMIPNALKERFVRAFVERIDFSHPRLPKSPTGYGRIYETTKENPNGDAVLTIKMRWVDDTAVGWYARVNTRYKNCLTVDDEEAYKGPSGFERWPLTETDSAHESESHPKSEESGSQKILFFPKKVHKKGSGGSGRNGSSNSGTPGNVGGNGPTSEFKGSVALPMRNATKPLINGFVSVRVRLHAPHSSHGGLGTRPTLILIGEPRWIDDGEKNE